MKFEEMKKELDLEFWNNEDNLLLFEEFLLSAVDEYEEYLLMRRQRTAVDAMIIDNFDIKSAIEMYYCSGPKNLSLKDFYFVIEDFKTNEPLEVVNQVIKELKNKREKNV